MRLDEDMKLAVLDEARDSALQQAQLLEEILARLRAHACARADEDSAETSSTSAPV